MSHQSFITAPFKGDRGKKILNAQAAYQTSDYLKDTRPEAEKKTHVVGKADGRACKFHMGFYRRRGEDIRPDAERLVYEEKRGEAQSRAAEARSAQLAAINSRNGNILLPALGSSASSPTLPRRRHFPEHAAAVEAQNLARQKVGASRFHRIPTQEEEVARVRTLEQRLKRQEQTTSVLGFGRNDLKVSGVVDNFRDASYTPADLLSKPKLRPAPSDSPAAKRASGQLVLQDGSDAAGWGNRRSETANSFSGARANSAQASRHGAGASSDVVVRQVARSNRGNESSAGLREAFSYPSVVHAFSANRGNTLAPVASSPAAQAAPSQAS